MTHEVAIREPVDHSLFRSRLLAGGGLLVATASGAVVANYVFIVLMSWLLPVEDYGVLAGAQTLLLIAVTILSAGFPWTVAQLTSSMDESERGQIDHGTVRGVIRVGLLGNLALALGLGAGVSVWAFSGSSTLSEGIKDLYVPFALALGLYAPLYVLRGALQGTFQFAELGLLAPTEALVKLVVATVLVALGFGLLGSAIGFAVGAGLALALGSVLLRRSIPWGNAEWPSLSTFRPTAPIFVGFVALAWLMHVDILGLGLWGVDSETFGDVGHYHAAALLARAPVYAVAALMTAAFPLLVRRAQNKELFVDSLSLIGRIVILLMMPILLVYTMMPGAALRLFFPEEFSAAGPSLAILSVAALGFALCYVLVVGLQAYGRPHVAARAVVVAVLVQGIALSILVPRMGSEGAAVSTLLGSVAALGLILISAVWTMGVVARLQDLALLGASTSMFAFALIVLPHDTRITTVVSVGTASIVYALCLLVAPSANRHRFAAYVRSRAIGHIRQDGVE